MSILVPVDAAGLAAAGDPVAAVLAWCQQGADALAEATTLEDGGAILAAVSTLEHVTRVRDLNAEACIAASSLRVRAERRMGQLIADEREAGRLAKDGQPVRRMEAVGQHDSLPDTLSDHGIPRDQAAAFTKLAAATPEDFEEAVESEATRAKEQGGTNVTRAGVLRKIDPTERTRPEQFADAEKFIATCKRLTALADGAVGAVRFGAWPDDFPALVADAMAEAIASAQAALVRVAGEWTRKERSA